MSDRKKEDGEIKGEKSKKSGKASMDSHREYLDMDTDEEEFGRQETPETVEEIPPEPEKPVFNETELRTLVQYVKDLTTLRSLKESDWNENCCKTVEEYFREPGRNVLTIFYRENILMALLDFPTFPVDGLTYFWRSSWHIYTVDNFLSTGIFGSFNGNIENSMLKFLENLYTPVLLREQKCPQIIEDNLNTTLHGLLMSLTDLVYIPMDVTVLYIPREGLEAQRFDSVKPTGEEEVGRCEIEKREYIARLEVIVCYWVKQIHEALAVIIVRPNLGDMTDEFLFWNRRYNNLTCLHYQLTNANVQTIIERLRDVQATCTDKFRHLTMKVQGAINEAASNIKYLSILVDACQEFSLPSEIEKYVPKIVHLLQFTWLDSRFYGKMDKMEALCHCLSSQVVKICQDYIDLDLIFQGNASKGRSVAEECISHCCTFKNIYLRLVAINDEINPDKNWNVDEKIVFHPIDAFVQRCRNVIEICDAAILFGSEDRVKIFIGVKGVEHDDYYGNIRELFNKSLQKIRNVKSLILDITNSTWLDYMCKFRLDVVDFENMLKNLIHDIFDNIKTAEEGVESLYALRKFRQRRCLQKVLNDKWIQIWKAVENEIESIAVEIIEDAGLYHPSMPRYSGCSSTLRFKRNYIKRQCEIMIDASDWLGDWSAQGTVLHKYRNVKGVLDMKENELFELWEKNTEGTNGISMEFDEPLFQRRGDLILVNVDVFILETVREVREWIILRYDVKQNMRKQFLKWPLIKSRYDHAGAICILFNRIKRCFQSEQDPLCTELLKKIYRSVSPGFEIVTWNSEFIVRFCTECISDVLMIRKVICTYKHVDRKVKRLFKKISTITFINPTLNVTYDLENFKRYLDSERNHSNSKLTEHFNDLYKLLIHLQECFETHEEKIMDHWVQYVTELDSILEKLILYMVHRSLHLSMKLFHGDGITIAMPLLNIYANYSDKQIVFSPDFEKIQEAITSIYDMILSLAYSLTAPSKFLNFEVDSFKIEDIITRDNTCRTLKAKLLEEVEHVRKLVEKTITSSECFFEISAIDTLMDSQFYSDNNVIDRASLETDMLRCSNLITKVNSLTDEVQVHFISINMTELKPKLLEICEKWKETLYIELSKVIARDQTSESTTPISVEEISQNISEISESNGKD